MNRRLVHLLCSFCVAAQMTPAFAAGQPELNFKIYSPGDGGQTTQDSSTSASPAPEGQPGSSAGANPSGTSAKSGTEKNADSIWSTEPQTQQQAESSSQAQSDSATTAKPADSGATSSAPADNTTAASPDATGGDSANKTGDEQSAGGKKLLQGYIRVVPSGTKVPIIMDTAVDSDTSQEGDEFAARTSEDLNIDGQTVVPAGSVIKGRIAALNSPKNMGRSGSVALKFDTVTTPDNRQIPLVANLVARGGVVHARRGLKDIAIDTGTFVLPTALGIGIGALAGGASKSSSSSGSSNKHLGAAGGALIGAGVGAAVGIIVLCIKKGKKVDVRPGDELKIELAEDLRMPM